MKHHRKINERLEQIQLAGKSNGSHSKTINRMQNEYRQAMSGKSRRLAIKCFCAECMGWEKPLANAIKACTDQGCSLYPYRPYQESVTAESDAKECTLSAAKAR
jgi:hypothetical protein